MEQVSSFDPLAKGRRHHKYAMAKDPSLPALIAGSGRVSVSGHVEFLAVDGSIISYQLWSEIVARFTRVATLSPAAIRVAAAKAAATVAASPAELAKYHVNALLDIACSLEGYIAKPGKTTQPHSVIAPDIAA